MQLDVAQLFADNIEPVLGTKYAIDVDFETQDEKDWWDGCDPGVGFESILETDGCLRHRMRCCLREKEAKKT